MPIRFTAHALPLAALGAIALAAPAAAQQPSGLPPLTPLTPLTPMSQAERQSLPPELRTGPVLADNTQNSTGPAMAEGTQTSIGPDGVETITRTRRIEAQRPPVGGPATALVTAPGAAQRYCQVVDCGAQSNVLTREQWIAECDRRTRGRGRSEAGTIILGLLGGVAGSFLGAEIAGAGDRVLGAALGAGGGSLVGGLIGSLFGRGERNRYDCAAALDSYLSQAPMLAANRAIPAAGFAPMMAAPAPAFGFGPGYPAQYGYTYAPPPQMVMVPVQTTVPQQVVVRENVREETYTVPGAARIIPAPLPAPAPRTSPKLIKVR